MPKNMVISHQGLNTNSAINPNKERINSQHYAKKKLSVATPGAMLKGNIGNAQSVGNGLFTNNGSWN